VIVSVDIVNFQSHPDTHIDFTDGLNVLVGSSRSGKSAIRRAIMWVITNRPSGLGVISWWNKKGDKLSGETKVTITLDNGTVISRVRSPELNGYIINGKKLEAVATCVPEEIQEAFRMADVNMSGQFDAPFLVSQSAGAVAQYLNEIINLEDADYYQKEIESDRRKCVSDAGDNNKKILELSTSIKEFDWIDEAEQITSSIKDKLSKYDSIDDSVSKIKVLKTSLDEAKDKIEKLQPIIDNAESLYLHIKQKLQDLTEAKATYTTLVHLRGQLEEAKNKQNIPIEGMERSVKRISKQITVYNDLTKHLNTVWQMYTEYNKGIKIIKEVSLELKETQRELDLIDICPLCGNKLKDMSVVF